MGSIFSFVCSDVKSKVEILEEFRANKELAANFESVKGLMNYEKEAELLKKKDYVSASRTLLRLHRGLGKFVENMRWTMTVEIIYADFIRNFLQKLGEIEAEDKTSSVCAQSYNETLANFHPFLIRKAANIAMYALPNRDQLLNKVCADVEASIKALPEMLQVTNAVYDRIDALYTKNDLHGLP